jgi:hypothetical protein
MADVLTATSCNSECVQPWCGKWTHDVEYDWRLLTTMWTERLLANVLDLSNYTAFSTTPQMTTIVTLRCSTNMFRPVHGNSQVDLQDRNIIMANSVLDVSKTTSISVLIQETKPVSEISWFDISRHDDQWTNISRNLRTCYIKKNAQSIHVNLEQKLPKLPKSGPGNNNKLIRRWGHTRQRYLYLHWHRRRFGLCLRRQIWKLTTSASKKMPKLFLDVTQRRLVVSHRRFGTIYKRETLMDQLLDHSNVRPIGSPETSLTNHLHTLRNIS